MTLPVSLFHHISVVLGCSDTILTPAVLGGVTNIQLLKGWLLYQVLDGMSIQQKGCAKEPACAISKWATVHVLFALESYPYDSNLDLRAANTALIDGRLR